MERKKWITEEAAQEVQKLIYQKKENAKNLYEKSKETPKHEEPDFGEEFAEQIKIEISSEVKKLRRIPKP